MHGHDAIQLDAAFIYQRAAVTATYRELRRTHGEAFAAHFIDEFQDHVLQAAKTRLCGLSEAAVLDGSHRLRGVSEAV